MKRVRDVCNNKDIIVVEVGDQILFDNNNFTVKEIKRVHGHRYIIVENNKGELYITDDKSINGIIN